LTGTTLRGEDGRWSPAARLEAWWNTDVPGSEIPGGHAIKDGPVLQVARVDDMNRCRFETSFTVPDVEAGHYQIGVFVWHEGGYGDFLSHEFEVTNH
jgi:hypothetical protein